MIAIGCDHGGFDLKETIKKHFDDNNIQYKDYGIHNCESIDYPVIATTLCNAITSGECEKGLLFCGTGIGMSIAANKFSGIRAACCSDSFSAKYTRLHNNANVLCLGGRVVGAGLAIELVDLFINTQYEGGRHQNRLDLISEIEKQNK
ncbi:MAG: ribose 5-phosphate isomerase B [Oscillospiraceae bacterium]